MVLESVLTCPKCGASERLVMPTNRCIVRHTCSSCLTELRPLDNDCCVFCSYGDKPCPSKKSES